MEDRELLELAAKASGNTVFSSAGLGVRSVMHWNPLERDDDAFRLACKMGMCVDAGAGIIIYDGDVGNEMEFEKPSEIANVRRAIVRAAAEIGKAMP